MTRHYHLWLLAVIVISWDVRQRAVVCGHTVGADEYTGQPYDYPIFCAKYKPMKRTFTDVEKAMEFLNGAPDLPVLFGHDLNPIGNRDFNILDALPFHCTHWKVTRDGKQIYSFGPEAL